MILSVSRRTDVPGFYSDWFFNRVKAGEVQTRNPMNLSQTKTLCINPDDVDCFVFWTKNPAPMLEQLDELQGYGYYFQFTLNAYGKEIEPDLPPVGDRIETFKRLAEKMKPQVVWRYDPIFVNENFTLEFHKDAFGRISDALKDYTSRCVISFIDYYSKAEANFKKYNMRIVNEDEINALAESFAGSFMQTPRHEIFTCAEEADLSRYGIGHAACIDAAYIEKITGRDLKIKKDRSQRGFCGCAASVDIGAYNTCLHGCRYCYANYSETSAKRRHERHDPEATALISREFDSVN